MPMRKQKLAASKAREDRVPAVPAVQRGDDDRELHALQPHLATTGGGGDSAVVLDPPRMASAQAAAQQEGRYVYGVIETREPLNFGRIAIGGANENVYTVQHGDIAAIVSKTAVF